MLASKREEESEEKSLSSALNRYKVSCTYWQYWCYDRDKTLCAWWERVKYIGLRGVYALALSTCARQKLCLYSILYSNEWNCVCVFGILTIGVKIESIEHYSCSESFTVPKQSAENESEHAFKLALEGVSYVHTNRLTRHHMLIGLIDWVDSAHTFGTISLVFYTLFTAHYLGPLGDNFDASE